MTLFHLRQIRSRNRSHGFYGPIARRLGSAQAASLFHEVALKIIQLQRIRRAPISRAEAGAILDSKLGEGLAEEIIGLAGMETVDSMLLLASLRLSLDEWHHDIDRFLTTQKGTS
jgi:hypothetical protein